MVQSRAATYAQHGIDIPLHGTPAELTEPLVRTQLPDDARTPLGFREQANFDHAAATWQGTRDKAGYRGRWIDARSGKTRNFTLRRVAEYDPDAVAPGPSKPSPTASPAASAAVSQAAWSSTCGRRLMPR